MKSETITIPEQGRIINRTEEEVASNMQGVTPKRTKVAGPALPHLTGKGEASTNEDIDWRKPFRAGQLQNFYERWATDNEIDAIRPNGSQLARYLVDLHQKEGLALKTILVHKSAISTLCDPNNHAKLSSHTLVKQVLKAIYIANPRQLNPPIWDIYILIAYLNQRDACTSNFYEASGHTAAVLLLCSGRRADGFVTLWPTFGSKTDMANRRQSGWNLIHNKDSKNFEPVYWIHHLIQLSQERRSETTTDHLFLTTFGKPKPATRTIISGWIKKLLRKAGIEDTPGSIRSSVA
ncbi:putative reverse transcriptase-7 [Operophtera brumata]|uniref:Putative reverse transcriptase-7 n=1 Tax=Operophtera brumata TaxID=104452 RepID=A0A0L7LPU4_OPEBR|nr:putative reverse transcriptase-7 [Operophtera brumata]